MTAFLAKKKYNLCFLLPILDYGDILYNQAFNISFHDRLESIQYNACLTITGAIRGTSKEKLYQEYIYLLGFDVGTESFVFLKKYLKTSILNIFSI